MWLPGVDAEAVGMAVGPGEEQGSTAAGRRIFCIYPPVWKPESFEGKHRPGKEEGRTGDIVTEHLSYRQSVFVKVSASAVDSIIPPPRPTQKDWAETHFNTGWGESQMLHRAP